MKIAIAQLNPTIGDLRGNAEKIRQAAISARQQGAELLVTPELSISGYPPKDLLHRNGFVEACDAAVLELTDLTTGNFGILIGHPSLWDSASGKPFNSATLLGDGKRLATIHKSLLPNYDVFDEERYFDPGKDQSPVEFLGKRLGIHICEDAWFGEPETFYSLPPIVRKDPVLNLAEQGVDIFINLSASPFEAGKFARRQEIVKRHVSTHRRPVVFANQIGGNDDLVFDGNSFVLNTDGEVVQSLAAFEEDMQIVGFNNLPSPIVQEFDREQELLDALVLGLGDYMRKCGFTDCVLGLSGGIDSALAAAIAARAVGGERVHAILMPSRYSTDHSIDDSLKLAEALGLDTETIPIDAVHRAYEGLPVVGEDLAINPTGLPDQNLQARIRGAIVMTRSNTHGWIPLATGNKSELSVGYCTLYGDMCGGFAALCDLYKQDVYELSRHINKIEGREVIPKNIIDKAPSAELAPNQFDQDSLPPYPILDAILKGLIDEQASPAELAKEFPEETVRWVVRQLDRNEFKRWQIPPGTKLSAKAFGTGRRMPMASRSYTGFEDS
ncbi:NAD+ synthase [Thalassoglobus sp.]|uniref:NAD+ synthase n=1 Tax=Thalassoglobus sp. TaxID=2795869 RepID=UPI003AA9AD0B